MKKTKFRRLAAMAASLLCCLIFTVPAYAQSSEPQPETTPAPVETHERRRRGSSLAAAFSVGPGTPDCLRASVRRRRPAPEIRPTGS